VPTATLLRGLKILGVAVREQPGVFAISVLGSALYALMTIASAYVFGGITERVILPAFRDGRTTTAALLAAAGLILAVAVLRAVGIVARRLFAGVMQYRLQASYRRRVTRQYLRLPLSWHQRHPTGELLSNANSDVEASWYPIAPFPFAVGVLFLLAVTGVVLVLTDPVLALVGLAVFPAVIAVNIFYSRRLSPRMTRAQQLRAEVSVIAHESFDGALVVKTLGREAEETARFQARAEQLRDSLINVGRVRGMFDPMMEALPQLGTLAVLLVGTARLEAGAISVSELVSVAYLFTVLALPIRAIGWVLGELPRSVVGFERVQRVLTATGEQRYGDRELPATSAAADLRLDAVNFGYDGIPVLHGLDLHTPPGRTLAVVGPTGSGKSTLAGLLVRLVDPDDGAVRLDAVDLRELRAGQVSSTAALVQQSTFLFDDDVRGNVTLGLGPAEGIDDDRVWNALTLAQADRFVRALPAGLDTRVGERGATLSGGQRQRLALARALVRRPRLLVLDDATSSVDPTVESAILTGLRAADLDSTVVVVAYRLASIELADEVVYVEHGRIVDRGTSAELRRRTPGYANLVTAYERAQAERALERDAQDSLERDAQGVA